MNTILELVGEGVPGELLEPFSEDMESPDILFFRKATVGDSWFVFVDVVGMPLEEKDIWRGRVEAYLAAHARWGRL